MGRVSVQRGQPIAKSFMPRGRSQFVLYAVQLRCQSGITKIGQTTNWKSRRRIYDNWNLARGDGIAAHFAFFIHEEFVDLPALERSVLASLVSFERVHGKEWFAVDLDFVADAIERVLDNENLCYSRE